MRRAVATRLGYDPFFRAARQTIAVDITDTAGGLQARMRLLDEHGIVRGSRELSEQANNCDELVTSLALAISIALDPSASLADNSNAAVEPAATTRPSAGKGHEGEPDAAAHPTAPPATRPPARAASPKQPHGPGGSDRTARFALRANVFAATGVGPSSALGGRIGAGVRWDWFQIVVELRDQLAAARGAAAGGSAQASLLAGSLAPCATHAWFAACALFDLGSLRAEGAGVANPVVQHLLHVAVGARAELSPRIAGHLHLLVSADALKSLAPITLRLHEREVWRSPYASFAASLGLEQRFP